MRANLALFAVEKSARHRAGRLNKASA
jgi:hypothetical protein